MSDDMHFEVTPMVERDVEAVLAIDLGAFEASDAEARRVRETQLREELVRTWARLRVARTKSGEVLGYALFWHVADELHLLNVAVHPAARRQGVGRALVLDLIAYGRAHEAAKVLLEVRRSNAGAIALYAGLGFTEFNVRERYYSDGEDGIEMMLTLA